MKSLFKFLAVPIGPGPKLLVGLMLLALIGFSALFVAPLSGSHKSIVTGLEKHANAALVDAKAIGWASVTMDGQKAILTGQAPSQEALDRTREAIGEAIWNGGVLYGGVTVVDTKGLTLAVAPEPRQPFKWRAEYTGDLLKLSGAVPSIEAHDLLIAAARSQTPNAEIFDQMEVSENAPKGDWFVAALTSLRALVELEEGSVSSIDTVFTIDGSTDNSIIKESINDTMRVLPQGYAGRTNIDLKNPAEPDAPSAEEMEIEKRSADALRQSCLNDLERIFRDAAIAFESRRSVVAPESRARLETIAEKMVACPDLAVTITGHTDTTGPETKNHELSQERAQAVLAALTGFGVAPERMTATGRGSTDPIASNRTSSGRARNRRIEITASITQTETPQENEAPQ